MNKTYSKPLAGHIDLHIHSTASDGTDTPTVIVQKAVNLGLDAIALTDHDCMDGVKEAVAEGNRLGLEVISGCEIAAETPYGEMHIVGLWMDQDNQEIVSLLNQQISMREMRNREILEQLKKVGINIEYDELESDQGSIGRPHIARALLKRGYVNSTADAFKRFLIPTRPAFVARKLLQPEEVLEIVKKAGATTIFAHPMSMPAPKEWIENTVKNLKEAGLLDGLEAYHPEHTLAKTRFVENMAEQFNLLLSGGSDYHGQVKSKIQLGMGEGKLRVPAELLDLIKQYRAK